MVQSLLRSDSFRILFNSPELSEVQRSGFHLFLKKGIAEELSKISCIQIKNVHFLVEIFVDASNFRLVAPENSYRDCILKMKSYTCKLYVQTKILLKDKVSEKLLHQTQPEWVLLADLPMMTRRGHFVINGSPRIIVHQVGRAPGIYFKKVLKVKNDVTNKARFYGDIIPRKGVWVRLQINKKGEIDLKLKKSKKVRAEMVQKCLELLEKEKSFSCFQNFVAGSQTKQDLLFATAKLKGNLNSKQSGAYYKTNPFSSTYKPNFNKATFYSCNRPVNAKALQKRSFCTAYKGTAFVRTKPRRLHKRSLCVQRQCLCQPRFVCATGGVPALFVQSTAKEQALIRNLFYFKSIKIKIVSKARSKSQLPNASKNKNNPGLLNKTKFNTVSFFARKISNTTNHINLHTFSSIHFLDNLDSSKYHERYQLALNKSPVYLPLNTNTCASNKIVRGFVIKYNSSKSFSAFTKTEKEAFANVYTSFYKNEIQDIEKRVSVSKNALLTHTKPSQNLAKPLPLKSNLLRAHELQIKSKNKSIPKTRLVKTKFSSSLSESQTKQSLVTTRASLGYDSKDKIVKKKNLSNNLKKIREYLYQLFKESDLYDLGSVGRDKINSKFGISIKETQLTALDIKKTINWLSRLRAGKEEIDDIDHSQNRRVRTSSELIQAQFEIGITRLKNGVLKRVLSPSGAINVKGEQIKASFDKKIQAKQSKVFLFEKNGYEELVRPRLLFCTNLIKHKTLAQNKVMQKQNKQTGFACKKPDACTNEAVLAKALLRTLDAQNSFVQSKIINNTPSFYSQIFWQSNKQSGANKADVCFANNFNLNSVFHAHSLPSSRLKVINKQTGLFHFVPLITCYLSIVFVESDFGLQIVKPVARAQTNSNKKQLNFEFTRLHFKGGNSCFVKQDVMSVILKPSKTKIQAFFSTGGCQNEVGLLAKICTGKASACTKPCKNAVFASRLQKRGLQRHGPNKGRAFVRKSFALASRLQKRSFLQVPLWHGFLQQKSSTLTQDALYPSNDLVSNLSASEWFSTKPINGALREFFSSSPLSQYMDQTNPLAEITHKRRISSLGAGGVSRESAGMTIRGIHPTHYGRICPIETPEGKNAGLVNSLAFYARINNQGFIETPYYQVIKGQVQHELGFSFYSAGQESRNGLSIAPNDIKQSRSKLLASNISTIESIPVRIADNLLDLFKKKRPSQVNCIGISPVQILSVATSLIPFLEHNDANRALMGSNMQRQAVSLMSSERPLVGTGLEARVLVESGHLVQSKVSGFISNVSAHRVIVERLMFDFNKKDALFSNYFVTKQSINRELHFLDLYKKPASLPQPTATLSQNSVLTKTFDDTVKQKRLLASGLFVRRASLNINWSIKKQNNNQSKYKQKFTKLNSTILDIVVAFTQPLKIQTKQSLLTQKSLGTTKLVQLIDPFTKTKVALLPVIHPITTFSRSNQETCLTQKPLVEEGDWVQKGDILSDCSAGQKGELSVGKNMFIAYIPWQGYNFEDAIVISDRLVKEQLYTSLHIERYTVIVNDFKDKVVDTNEWFTGKLPGVDSKKRAHLQKSGLPRIGATLREGDILVGKIKYSKKKPATPHEKLVCDILGEHNFSVQNTSLYVPKGVHEARVLTYKIKKRFDKALRTGIATGEMKNETELTKAVPLYAKTEALQKQRPNKTGVYKGITKALPLLSLCKQKQIFNKRLTKTEAVQKAGLGQEQQNMSLKARVGKDGAHLRPAGAPKVVHIFLGEKRNIQIGDKMSGRHGNKGIVSTILPKQDMPYLADGSPIDILLNPLGVPSRMNVGQVFECLLGLASTYLHQNFKITAFDELYGVEASQSLVFLKLYQARLQSGQNWLFQINFPGKTRLTDGRSGECLDQWITVGRAYMLKLIHMVNEKIHARAIGPYALVTQQPLKGRAHKGGQRLGEMEVWAIEGFGAAYILQELLTKKSDDSIGRKEVLKAMLPKSASLLDFMDPFGQSINTSTQSKENKTLYNAALVSSNLNSDLVQHQSFTVLGQPDIFKVLICELQALCLDVGVYSIKTESFQRQFVGIFEQSS